MPVGVHATADGIVITVKFEISSALPSKRRHSAQREPMREVSSPAHFVIRKVVVIDPEPRIEIVFVVGEVPRAPWITVTPLITRETVSSGNGRLGLHIIVHFEVASTLVFIVRVLLSWVVSVVLMRSSGGNETSVIIGFVVVVVVSRHGVAERIDEMGNRPSSSDSSSGVSATVHAVPSRQVSLQTVGLHDGLFSFNLRMRGLRRGLENLVEGLEELR
mmetsp:Transcript_31626/g.48372  ORF Transcript_31626/g.48372 Transcript_31626/m.48372 type:complete len:218 (-) Transcript_31626:34-687(-)